MDTTKDSKTLIEEATITYKRRDLSVWKVFYFKKSNLYRLMIDNKWLPGSFVCRDKITEAYKTYKMQGYTVKVTQKDKPKIKRTRMN